MVALQAAQIIADLALEHGVDGLVAVVAHQHIFGRNGAVGLKLETPMAVALAEREQRGLRALDAVVERIEGGGSELLRGR